MTTDSKPWNSWRGLHEGDMAVELAEMDSVIASGYIGVKAHENASAESYDTLLDRYYNMASDNPEGLRMLWWYAIGRHMGGNDK